MRFVETSLEGAYLIHLNTKRDERGSFSRLFCSEIFMQHGIENSVFVQVNLSSNSHKGTLRGMHYQTNPHMEAKVVYCLRGRVFDVMVDLRPNSKTYLSHYFLELSQDNSLAVFIPEGFAHGFLTLEPNSEIFYLMSEPYHQEYQKGFHWNDPTFQIKWPSFPPYLSERDQNHPLFRI
ncbi:MAG: dTDP-4-dehydrorhamnose 3,5-epimerase [Chlamydiae bacterium]|nr:dTDP-4-dehydrorhamnose 3,5-epimerase [Chlamydiota bacterium]